MRKSRPLPPEDRTVSRNKLSSRQGAKVAKAKRISSEDFSRVVKALMSKSSFALLAALREKIFGAVSEIFSKEKKELVKRF